MRNTVSDSTGAACAEAEDRPHPAGSDADRIGRLKELSRGDANDVRDLRGLNATGLDLSGLDLSGYDLSGAQLGRANLTNARLIRTRLEGASLFEADLAGAELLGADLRDADLSECKAERASFGQADLTGAKLFNANFRRARFTSATLRGVDARAANLLEARLREACLEEADFSGADLRETDMEKASVARALFIETDFRQARMRGITGYDRADWIGADILNVDFVNAHLASRFIRDQNYLHEFRRQSRLNAVLYQVWWATSDCGRSFLRWGLWTSLLAVVFAVVYEFVNVDFGAHPTYLSSIYYSVVTLTTLGYGDVLPASPAAQIAAMIEVILGYVMLGGLLSIFSNKMARRAD